uniref:Uncharacterized protein n=1 Tax=Anguilla anguilla TaxID=7936 RepID=A0A0E9XKX0_ANGAN
MIDVELSDASMKSILLTCGSMTLAPKRLLKVAKFSTVSSFKSLCHVTCETPSG